MRQPQTSPTLLTSLGLRVLGAQSLLWLAPRWLCAFEASHHPSDGPWVLSAASWGLSPRGRWETVLSVAGEALHRAVGSLRARVKQPGHAPGCVCWGV